MQNALTCLREISEKSSNNPAIVSPELLTLVTRLFLLCGDQLGEPDRDLFGDVLGQIAFELGGSSRASLARRLAKRSKAPNNIVSRLARDDVQIAAPLLRTSPCLSNDDLIAIVEECSRDHARCILERDRLSSTVTDAIIRLDDAGLLRLLLGNAGATLSEEGWAQIQDHMSTSSEVLKLINQRDDRPPSLALLEEAGSARAGTRSVADQPGAVSEGGGLPKPAEGVISDLALQKIAKSGDMEATVEQLAVLTGEDPRLVRHCLLQPEIKALAVLCKAEELQDDTFAALVQLRLKQRLTRASDVAAAIKRYRDMSTEQAQSLVNARKKPKPKD